MRLVPKGLERLEVSEWPMAIAIEIELFLMAVENVRLTRKECVSQRARSQILVRQCKYVYLSSPNFT
jgi:hypothetical protein